LSREPRILHTTQTCCQSHSRINKTANCVRRFSKSLQRRSIHEQLFAYWPTPANKLSSVLVRGHFNPVAITGDLQKALLQVRVKETDRDAMRFHWRRDKQFPLETLRFTRALFGLVPSPFLLGGVIETHLNHWEEKEPEQVAKICREL